MAKEKYFVYDRGGREMVSFNNKTEMSLWFNSQDWCDSAPDKVCTVFKGVEMNIRVKVVVEDKQ